MAKKDNLNWWVNPGFLVEQSHVIGQVSGLIFTTGISSKSLKATDGHSPFAQALIVAPHVPRFPIAARKVNLTRLVPTYIEWWVLKRDNK